MWKLLCAVSFILILILILMEGVVDIHLQCNLKFINWIFGLSVKFEESD